MSLSEPKVSLGEWGEGFGAIRKNTKGCPVRQAPNPSPFLPRLTTFAKFGSPLPMGEAVPSSGS
jgi:hypothetical protein